MTQAGQRRHAALALGFLSSLTGCISTTPALPPAGPQFDGSYVGQDVLVSGAVFQCGEASRTVRINVSGGRFDYPFPVNPPRVAPLPVQIAADGTVRGQMQYGTTEETPKFGSRELFEWVTLSGRITGRILDADVVFYRCARHLTVQRQ